MATSRVGYLLHVLFIILALLQLLLATNLIAGRGGAAPIIFLASAQPSHPSTAQCSADIDAHPITADHDINIVPPAFSDQTVPSTIHESGYHQCAASTSYHMEATGCTADGSPVNAPDTLENIIWPHISIRASSAASPPSVLIFQTSMSVPCITTPMFRPPRYHEPPVHLMIASPTQSGTYPVILFKHGFVLANCFYTQLFQSLASFGYIVAAPQAATVNSDATEEIEETAKVARWIPKSLAIVLNAAVSNASVIPDVSKLVMAGHSRGGKVAFAMVLQKSSSELPSFSALVALDPVDGTGPDALVKPPIVAVGCGHTLNRMPIPVLTLGTGYGSRSGMLGMPPCAPTCCNHAAYFNCSSSPIMYDLLASDFGHLDFLDDSLSWTSGLCVSASSKAPLRRILGICATRQARRHG